ncbi:uncharacterized protein G2W53_021532 [Senna tora]|uniref:Uncharacterized protein n=1 Tax=Senna tora TaxID=362788 RepID=A0A834TJS0_9FABA|nr:uncharacterized protein G2W53_021532 [Senna tora]
MEWTKVQRQQEQSTNRKNINSRRGNERKLKPKRRYLYRNSGSRAHKSPKVCWKSNRQDSESINLEFGPTPPTLFLSVSRVDPRSFSPKTFPGKKKRRA